MTKQTPKPKQEIDATLTVQSILQEYVNDFGQEIYKEENGENKLRLNTFLTST